MFGRKVFISSLVTASLVVVPVQRAQANDAAAILGGAILGGIIVNEVNKNKRRKTTTRSSGMSSAQREQNRSVQRALNYFGYNVGAADGSIGRNTRAGIARYQADMGFNPDGTMEPYERDFLLNSHQRALGSSHVMPYSQIIATQGTPGLLRTYRNEQLGIATPNPAPQPGPVPASTPPTTQPPTTQPPTTVPQDVTRTEPAGLPDFTFGKVARSINEHCNEINVLTAANGGITTAGRITDPEFALNEQFCLARTHAMAESTTIVATIPNMTDEQIQQQCDGLAQVMVDHVAGIENKQVSDVISQTSSFLQGTGRPMESLISGGKVCLGVGYRIDNAEMALASAVLLAGADQGGYGEIVSHHLREGFGVPKAQPAIANAWMAQAVASVENGGAPMTGQTPERIAVLKAAMQGGTAAPGTAALPSFPSNN